MGKKAAKMTAPTSARVVADTDRRALGRAYALILSWPCRHCGQPAPCQCGTAGDELPTTAADARANEPTQDNGITDED
jgi:hypothetical protein